ncbi:MAG: DUF4197 domain-containing protein [Candidatus Dadabacteria bacterium]
MKKLAVLSLFSFLFAHAVDAQILKSILKKDSSGNINIGKIIKQVSAPQGLSNQEIINGLKEALNVGANNATGKLSAADGFFKDAAIKVLMPAEAASVEKKLRTFGMGKLVDDAVLSMNRAAEDAAKSAAPIFLDAVKKMTIQDAVGILRGDDFAATHYLKAQTTSPLTEAFRPVVQASVDKVNATKYWNTVFSAYNRFSSEKVNTDLTAYVTEKALAGIFYQLGLEEQKIRKDPMARTTEILKKVFAN